MNQQPEHAELASTPGPVTGVVGSCVKGPPAATVDGQFCSSTVGLTAATTLGLDDASKSTRQPQEPRYNKSCEFCAKRKRRCDGDGLKRCRLVS